MRRTRPGIVMLLPLFGALHACAAGDSVVSDVVVRDSAGIAIVENGASAPQRTFTMSAEPILEIGQIEGAEEYQLYNVRHVVPFPDGSLAVSQGGTEVRFYDSTGRYLRTAGREGSGPGEFRRITHMSRLDGDSLLIFDSAARRITIIAPDGQYARDFAVATTGEQAAMVAGALPDGTLLVRASSGIPASSQEIFRDTVQYSIVRGDSVISLRGYPGPETGLNISQSGGAITSIEIRRLNFARGNHASSAGDRFHIGSSDTYEIHEFDSAGRLTRIIRSAHIPERAVTDELLQQAIDSNVAASRRFAEEQGNEFDEGSLRRRLDSAPSAPSVPLYAGLLASDDGGLWVQDYTIPQAVPSDTPERWSIFDADGRLRGSIDMPPRFQPMHVTADRVIGVITDEYDVQYVRVYTFSG